ncbi:hypothetical protein HPB51_003241 [Rhipicephalus microplus]|uniref:Uncharacterized protein n=1 Tax=Rhipicephalus microplus TaxID=6941 RepID=A0A9J6ERH5_RHIMP|nr:hypothetical protein HPB51_003241 [Rhipicephalus microplus]
MDGRLYKLGTWQQLLESEMCFQHCIPAWSPSDQLDGLACGQTMKVSFLTKVLVVFLVGYKENLVDYTASSLVRMLQSTTARPHRASDFPRTTRVSPLLTDQENILPLGQLGVLNDHTLRVFLAPSKIFLLEQAELCLGLVGTV